MLDLGFFRIGGEEYAEENNSFGLATIRREHVRLEGGAVVFDYPAKSGKQRIQQLVDVDIRSVVLGLLRRTDDSDDLLAHKAKGRWRDVRSAEINAYVRGLVGVDSTSTTRARPCCLLSSGPRAGRTPTSHTSMARSSGRC